MNRIAKKMAVLGACGLAATAATAQPFQIIGSGATLQESFLRSFAATNDFLDVDSDGRAGILGSALPDQLAPADLTVPFNSNQYWQVGYRISGSVFGFRELRDWGFISATAADGDAANNTLNSSATDDAIYNREDLVTAGSLEAIGDAMNPGGFPFRADPTTFAIVSSGGGIGVDFAVLDVPVSWATLQGGAGRPDNVPGDTGYGNNERQVTLASGELVDLGTFSNRLASLEGFNGATNVNTSSPDSRTIFDTPISLTPVAAIVNFGTGRQDIMMSDLRHLNATGRSINGENLMVVTRDSGSGTRNAFMNGICLDPSYGVGENIGLRTTSSSNDLLGPNFQPSNKGGSSRMDATVQNHRLAIGHTGAERGVSRGWLTGGRLELLGVVADLKGGSVAARPTLANVIDGGADGYNITGPATIATMGDARNENLLGGDMGNTNPAPRNENAGVFLNNITRSIGAIINPPAGATTDFTPGEFLFSNFLLVAAADNVPQTNPPAGAACIPLVANPELNVNVQNLTLQNSGQVFLNPAYQSFNTTANGVAPVRTAGVAYSETNGAGAVAAGASPDGQRYTDQAGNPVAYGSALTSRNKIFFDFNGDGARSMDDFAGAVAAWQDRNGGAAWAAGTDAVVEILGDANGNGSFDAEDIRYAADGLAINDSTGNLDRMMGFMAVDAAFGGNFFGTTMANGTYDAGDSAGDIAGADLATEGRLPTRGFVPNGHDGVVDGADIDYVFANFGDWSNLDDAIDMDLSADMNGDLVVDIADVCKLLELLETSYGDVNLDGTVDSADRSIIEAAQNEGSGWADGDINGDGVVDQADLDAFDSGVDPCSDCLADWDGSGGVDIFDILAFLTDWNAMLPATDVNNSGMVDIFDILDFLVAWNAGCP